MLQILRLHIFFITLIMNHYLLMYIYFVKKIFPWLNSSIFLVYKTYYFSHTNKLFISIIIIVIRSLLIITILRFPFLTYYKILFTEIFELLI